MLFSFFHPHFVGSKLVLNHFCTTKCTQKICCQAASTIGGRLSSLTLDLLAILEKRRWLGAHLRTMCLQNCLENLFFHKLPANQGKMMNQLRTTGSCVKIVGEIGKSSWEHGREENFRRTLYPLSRKHPLCSSKNCLEMVRNKLFANPVLITRTSCM